MYPQTTSVLEFYSDRKLAEVSQQIAKWNHDIKFTELPKGGVDQCNKVDDPTGENNFYRVFGKDLATDIDFRLNQFKFGMMRKSGRTTELQLSVVPKVSHLFQANLTRFLGTLDAEVVVRSYYNNSDLSFGAAVSSLNEKGSLCMTGCELMFSDESAELSSCQITRYVVENDGRLSELSKKSATCARQGSEKRKIVLQEEMESFNYLYSNVGYVNKSKSMRTTLETRAFLER
jgi:hypothetical protein